MKFYVLFIGVVSFIILTSATVFATPDMHLYAPDNTEIDSGFYIYGFPELGVNYTSQPVTFTIKNQGSSVLDLNGNPNLIVIGGADPSMFIIDESSTSSQIDYQAPNNTTTFTIAFNPTSVGFKNATICIPSTDPSSPFEFVVVGVGVTGSPNIVVKDQIGSVIPHYSGTYDFGSVLLGTSSPQITFTIENTGSSNLELHTMPTITGPYAAQFSIDVNSTSTPIAPYCSTTFKITFTPTAAGVAYYATVSIDNNCDPTIDPYTFEIYGSGYILQNDMKVYDPYNQLLAKGTSTYDIGNVNENSAETIWFKITNTGTDPLTLTGTPKIQFSGTGASAFTNPGMPISLQIQPGSYAFFTIQFLPTTTQLYEAKISIPNDDYNDNPYEFNIRGKGVQNESEINIKQSTSVIPSPNGYFDFGYVQIGSVGLSKVFTVENLSSTTPLSLSNVSITVSDFTVTQQPGNSIAASGSSFFTIKFDPTSYGNQTATVTITTNDPNENSFTFTVKGYGYASDISVTQDSGMISYNILNGTGVYDFGSVSSGSCSSQITFTIHNSGNYQLLLSYSPDRINKDGGDINMFVVTQASQYIAPNNSTTFTITFYPTAVEENQRLLKFIVMTWMKLHTLLWLRAIAVNQILILTETVTTISLLVTVEMVAY